jgi:undecaprenol kinase
MKLVHSFKYALSGIRSAFISEKNLRFHVLFACIALLCSFVFKLSRVEWIAVCGCIAFVITVELLNTAIEKLCDIVSKEIHPGIKKVKDISAGAVLVTAMFSIITGTLIFLPKIIAILKNV